jgi:conjugative transfer signal peptidase TraF
MNKLTATFLGVFVPAVLIAGVFVTMGGIINTADSIPTGLYKKVDKPLAIGKTVLFCPPDKPEFQEALKRGYIAKGSCPKGYGNQLLKIAAKRKNVVSINAEGINVDGKLLPGSKPAAQDRENRPLPALAVGNYELKENEVLLISESPEFPYDSRYFGVVEADQVESVIEPMF